LHLEHTDCFVIKLQTLYFGVLYLEADEIFQIFSDAEELVIRDIASRVQAEIAKILEFADLMDDKIAKEVKRALFHRVSFVAERELSKIGRFVDQMLKKADDIVTTHWLQSPFLEVKFRGIGVQQQMQLWLGPIPLFRRREVSEKRISLT